jgi:chromosome segregation ATPase
MCRAHRVLTVCALALTAALAALTPAHAQSDKQNPSESAKAGQARLQQQQRVTAAYRELEQAQFESRRAEQDVLNTEDAYNTARGRAEALKNDLDKFNKARDAAKAREAAARKRYDEALNAVPR